MGLSAEAIREGLDHVAALEPLMREAIVRIGYPEPRLRPTGYVTLLRTIDGQQVSVAAAASVWNKLAALLGDDIPPETLLSAHFDDLRA